MTFGSSLLRNVLVPAAALFVLAAVAVNDAVPTQSAFAEEGFRVLLPALFQASATGTLARAALFTNDLGPAAAIAVDGTGTIAYAGQGSMIVVIDIADVAKPREITRIGPFDAPVLHLRIFGDRLYVADGDGGLLTFDVRAPSLPTLLGRYDASVRRIAVADGLVVATAGPGLGRVILVDVSEPRSPTLLSTVPTQDYCSFNDVEIRGNRAYVSSSPCDLFVLDIANPAKPNIVSGAYSDRGDSSGVRAADGLVYVETTDGPSVAIYGETTDGLRSRGSFRPFPITYFDGTVWEWDVPGILAADGRDLIVGGWFDQREPDGGPAYEGIWVINTVDPRRPSLTAMAQIEGVSARHTGGKAQMAVSKRTLLVANDLGVSLFRLSRNAAPVRVPLLD